MKIKRILILYKQSTHEHYSINKTFNLYKGQPISKRFIKTHFEHYFTLEKVEEFLDKQGIDYVKLQRGRKTDFSPYDLILTVGGDGTFLEAASQAKSQLMLGINSDPQWSVGKFCHATSENFSEIILKVLQGRFKILKLNRMKIFLHKSRRVITALNDILICHSNPAAMSRYELRFRKMKEEQRSSGVWIATAAGSTGAIHSAGGRVLPEESKELQFVARELYCGRSQKHILRSAVFGTNDKLEITSLMKDGIVYVDGSHVSFPFPFGEKLTIRNSTAPIRLIKT